MQLLSVKDTAKRFNISERRVQKLCETGRIVGARLISNVWLIPDDSPKPADGRLSSSIDDMLTLNDLCRELSISLATGRNWIKLGKMKPTLEVKRTLYFSKKYVEKLKKTIENGDNKTLKTRRNKKFKSGLGVYRSYVSPSSENLSTVQSIVDYIKDSETEVTEELISAIIFDAATKMLDSKLEKGKSALSKEAFQYLIDDLLKDTRAVQRSRELYPALFSHRYVYEPNEDILGLIYISLKNIIVRKAEGVYYTPTAIVQKLCNQLFAMNEIFGKTIIDPCCGTGNFILQLPEGFSYDRVYANDTDEVSVKIARINYALKYEITDATTVFSHITMSDYLKSSCEQKFDFIIGNPPWGYDFDEEYKYFLRHTYSSAWGTNIESYDVFVQQSFRHLNLGGVLSFVLPEAILHVKSHMPIRDFILKNSKPQYLEYLGNAFDQVQCPSIIFQLEKSDEFFSGEGLIVKENGREFTIKTPRELREENLSFTTSDEEQAVLDKIASLENRVTLADQSVFAIGIVTGDNGKYISTRKKANSEIVVKGSDLRKYRIVKPKHYIVPDVDAFQQVAPMWIYRAKEKLLYRFITSQLVFAYDDKQTLSLNSCNVLIPEIEGLDIKYVMTILNSRIAQFYFKKKFNSFKVLKSHIENIPIPYIALEDQKEFIVIADELANASSENAQMLYDRLDEMIRKLYCLTGDEYDLVKNSTAKENLFLI